ncbi:MAG: hypothetical protein HRT88_09260 [Lentisphaeraceae bacterium]|nr:hypothetical protein [Lentisphaeraceae bacterium]
MNLEIRKMPLPYFLVAKLQSEPFPYRRYTFFDELQVMPMMRQRKIERVD